MNRRAIESTVFKITLGKHIVGKGFKFLERHVFHGTFYLSYQFVTLVVVVVIETMGECCHDLKRLYVDDEDGAKSKKRAISVKGIKA